MKPNNKNFTDKLIPQHSHGLSINDCQPVVVFARVMEIRSENYNIRSLNKNRSHESTDKQSLTFQYETDGEPYRAHQEFRLGDVVPELGQWVRGVVVPNQWGTYSFITTHLMKPKDTK